MKKTNNNQSFLKTLAVNMSYAYISQAISTILSLIFTLFLPKVLGVNDYGYWQLVVFYTTYLGVFYIGVNDGLYLRTGGKNFDEIDKPTINTICLIFFLLHSLIACIIATLSMAFLDDNNRIFVICATAVYLPFFNLKGLLGQLLQAVNRTRVSSISVVIDKLTIFFAILIAIPLKIHNFKYYVAVYIISGIIATIYCCYEARKILLTKIKPILKIADSIKENIKAGFPLMLSSFAALLIIGSSRQVIDIRWNISLFSKVSLTITMMNITLVFLNQSGLVLFPSIRKIDYTRQAGLYFSLNKVLNIIMPIVLIAYVPIGKVIIMWLPDYVDSVIYLGILLPICLFDGKMSLLNNTYFKVLRLEKQVLLINIITFLVNLSLATVGAYIFNNILFIVYGILFSISFRCLISEVYLCKHMNKMIDSSSYILALCSLSFVLFNAFLHTWLAFVAYTLLFFFLLLLQKRKFIGAWDDVIKIMKSANWSIKS